MTAARTADRIVAGNTRSDTAMFGGVAGLRAKLADRSLPVIVADNVAAYTLAQADKGNEYRVGEWPCLAPPWDWAFIEYPSASGRQRRGAHVIGFDLDALSPDELGELDGMIGGAIADGHGNYPDAHVRFALALLMFGDDGHSVHGPLGAIVFALDEHGKELGNRWYYRNEETWAQLDAGEPEGSWLFAAALPALQTIAFMHCRNVVVDRASRPAALAKKYRRKTGHDPVRWQTVRLELPRKAHTGGGTVQNPGQAPDLHIVPGHFAHYGNCCPSTHEPNGLLFGRLEGRYWVPQHMRGDPAREVRSDRIVTVSDPDA